VIKLWWDLYIQNLYELQHYIIRVLQIQGQKDSRSVTLHWIIIYLMSPRHGASSGCCSKTQSWYGGLVRLSWV